MEKQAVSESNASLETMTNPNQRKSNEDSHSVFGLFPRANLWRHKKLSGVVLDICVILLWLAIWHVGRIVEYTEHASVWFPAAGFTLSCFLVVGLRAFLPIMVASVVITLWNGHHYGLALTNNELVWGGLLFGLAHMLPYFVGASILGYLLRKPEVTTPQLIVSFLVVCCLSSLVATQLVIGSLVLTDQMPLSDVKHAMLPFWIGDMAGVVVLTPLFTGLLIQICTGAKVDLLAFSNCVFSAPRNFLKKVAVNLTLIFLVMLLAKLTQSRDSAFAIFFLAITHMWIACTESSKRNVVSLALSSVTIVLLVHFFELMEHVKVYQFALNVIAANALFGIAIPQLQADNAQLKDRVFIDSLTQAYTREYLTQRSALEIAQSHESGRPLFFAIFDLDKFKDINDRLGHIDGDNALKRLSKTTQETLRKNDIFARFGGDEFVLLLPGVTQDYALDTIEKLRVAISAITIGDITLSTSFGVTKLQARDTLESVLKRADGALYTSKEAGGNRITLA
jgi:diguanylate cyclase (GGDEF)-like protein